MRRSLIVSKSVLLSLRKKNDRESQEKGTHSLTHSFGQELLRAARRRRARRMKPLHPSHKTHQVRNGASSILKLSTTISQLNKHGHELHADPFCNIPTAALCNLWPVPLSTARGKPASVSISHDYRTLVTAGPRHQQPWLRGYSGVSHRDATLAGRVYLVQLDALDPLLPMLRVLRPQVPHAVVHADVKAALVKLVRLKERTGKTNWVWQPILGPEWGFRGGGGGGLLMASQVMQTQAWV